jgi:membrane-bound lytic murein transglycosylase MltF
MMQKTQYDDMIHETVNIKFPQLLKDLGEDAWLYVKAQVWQESRFNPKAVSPCGAQGLMQLMPGNFHIDDPFDPKQNVNVGVSYLAEQYSHFPEIPEPIERLKFALASYNGGRGYINAAAKLAREAGLKWQQWIVTRAYLKICKCNGKSPDWKQIWGYVDDIFQENT